MTLPAGFDYVVSMKRRFRIPYRKHIMRAMAVITFRGRGITEFGHFAMKSIKISLGYTLMTSAAGGDNFSFEIGLIRSGYFMR